MKKLQFNISIQASAERVWQVLWNDTTYRQWASVFCEGTHAISTWKEGDTIQFLSPSGEGIHSRIHQMDVNKYMAFKHLGILKEFKEQPEDAETAKWSGAMETYLLTKANGQTTLTAEMDSEESHVAYFTSTFPKALEVIKSLAEGTVKPFITVLTTVNAPIDKVWECWTAPQHITKWCQASDDWHAPYAENDLKTAGRFKTTMAAKDGSVSFDFSGRYTEVQPKSLIEYTMDDDRKVRIRFSEQEKGTQIIESFEPESLHSHDLQRGGWQAILDNFKKYTEAH